MDDYIKRKNAINTIKRFEGYLDQDMMWRLIFAIEHHIESEDVVPVVKCKDCESFGKIDKPLSYDCYTSMPYDYCCKGVKKEET